MKLPKISGKQVALAFVIAIVIVIMVAIFLDPPVSSVLIAGVWIGFIAINGIWLFNKFMDMSPSKKESDKLQQDKPV